MSCALHASTHTPQQEMLPLLSSQGVFDIGHTWNGEHNLKSPSPQGNSLFTKKVFSQALNQLLLALMERGGRLVAACPPRQCWPPPKPTKGSGNLPREPSQGIFPHSPAGFWMKPHKMGVQRVSVPSVSPAALNTPPPFPSGVTHRLSVLD